MLDLTEEQVKFIRDYFDQEEAQKMLSSDNLDDILLPLDALITYQGFDDDYQPTAWGNLAEIIYGQIYSQNKKQ